MQALPDAALLDLWDSGRRRSPIERSLLLLSRALPDRSASALADFSVPRRDAEVLALRAGTFGTRLAGAVACPHCDEKLEFTFDCGPLLAKDAAIDPPPIRIGEHQFRLPNSNDLLAISAFDEPVEATHALLGRCCLDATDPAAWSDEQLAEAEAGLSAHAGAADTRFAFDCEACGQRWESALDICAYFWEEIDARAQTLLDDVHRLALAYGWDEPRILALGDTRRAAYLARCDA